MNFEFGIKGGVIIANVALLVLLYFVNWIVPISINILLVLILLIIAGIFLFKPFNSLDSFIKDRKLVKKLPPYLVLSLLFFLGNLSFFVIKNYTYPSSDIYKNIDYHALEHLGFTFEDELFFKDKNESSSELFSEWNDEATVSVTAQRKSDLSYQLKIKKLKHPVYLGSSGNLKKSPASYDLLNPTDTIDLSKGFVLTYKSIEYKVEINEFDNKAYYLISYDKDNVTQRDTSDFEKRINYGYPLKSIFTETNIRLGQDLIDVLDGFLLLRSRTYRDMEKVNQEKLLLFSRDIYLAEYSGLQIKSLRNGSKNVNYISSERAVETEVLPYQKFYFGFEPLGGNKKNVYALFPYKTKNAISYQHPVKYKLKNKSSKDSVLFLTSSVQEIVKKNYDAGYYLPFFNDASCNHMRASLNYISGTARDSMIFKIIDMNSRNNKFGEEGAIEIKKAANDTIVLTSKNNNLSWLLKFRDLRADNPLQVKDLNNLLLLVVLLIGITVFLYKKRHGLFPEVELALYLFLLGILIIRLIITWRIGTFPPIEEIQFREFNKLRDIGNFLSIYWVILLLFTIRILTLCGSLFYKEYENDFNKAFVKPKKKSSKYWTLIFKSIALFSILAIALPPYKSFVLKLELIGVIVFVALLLSTLWYLFYKKINRTASSIKQNGVWRLIGLVCYFIIFVGLAGLHFMDLDMPGQVERALNIGFPLMLFLMFFGIYQYCQYKNTNSTGMLANPYYQKIAVMVIPAIYFSISDKGFCILFLLFGFMYFFLEKVMRMKNKKKKKSGSKLRISSKGNRYLFGYNLFFVLAVLVLTWTISVATSALKLDDNQIKYRSQVQSKELSEIAAKTGFQSRENTYFLRAAHNQWFIDNYNRFAREVSVFGNYFRIQPHSNKGASYIVQTTDLIVLRYLIAEHKELSVFLILILFIFIFYKLIRNAEYLTEKHVSDLNSAQFPLAIFLMLFIIALFVWLTVTNRFVFFGQDFPFLSITSKYMTGISFLLLFSLPYFLKEWNYKKRKNWIVQNNFFSGLRKQVDKKSFWLIGPLFTILIGMFIFGNQESDSGVFDLSDNIQNSQRKISEINSQFISYQRKLKGREGKENFSKLTLDSILQKYMHEGETKWKEYEENTNGDDLLTSSMLENFRKSDDLKKRDPFQIVHAIRPEGNEYQLRINNNFYRLKGPPKNNSEWEGAILAADNKKKLFIKINSTNSGVCGLAEASTPFGIPYDEVVGDVFANLPKSVAGDINNLSLAHIPASWSRNNNPILIIRREEGQIDANKGHFTIIRDEDVLSSKKPNDNKLAYQINPFDLINLEINKETVTQLEVFGQFDDYLAKNIWFNGKKRKLFFPLKDKFLWAFNVGNLAKSEYSKEKNIQLNRKKTIRTSIDFNLTKSAFNEISSISENYDLNKKMCVVGMDGNGKVRLMLDYKPSVIGKFDPNDMRSYYEEVQKFYSESDQVAERGVFGNQCLLKMENGPGSTIKPIVYGATVAGVNFPWRNLMYNAPTAEIESSILKGGRLVRYGGNNIRKWKLGSDDYLGNWTPRSYIKRSKNSYHSLIVFMGSFKKEELNATRAYIRNPIRKDTMVFITQSNTYSDNKSKQFPRFSFGGSSYVFDEDRWPKSQDLYFGKKDAILPSYLNINFDLPTSKPHYSKLLEVNKNIFNEVDTVLLKSKGSFNLWAYPEDRSSGFLTIDRSNKSILAASSEGLRQSTVGAYPVEVSPLKMAEMGTRLFKMQKNISASLLDDSKTVDYLPFTVDESWGTDEGGLRNVFSLYQESVFGGMYGSANERDGGTAASFMNEFKDGAKGYYFYTKTGTIGSADGPSYNDKNLLVIISKARIHDSDFTFGELKNNKIYTVYFSFNNSTPGGNWPLYARNMVTQTLNKILESDSFINYMK